MQVEGPSSAIGARSTQIHSGYMRWVSRSMTETLGGASLLNHVEVIPHKQHGSKMHKLSLCFCFMT